MTSTEPVSDTTRPHSNVCYACELVYTPPPSNCYALRAKLVFSVVKARAVWQKPPEFTAVAYRFPWVTEENVRAQQADATPEHVVRHLIY
jgi:hypothetical protein